jgi:ABC-2 type transport system ATP-binding protein
VTIILATPYMDEAERCGRVGMLAAGRLLALDTPENLKRSMKDPVLEIVAEDNRRAFSVLRGLPTVKSVQLFGDRLNVVAAEGGAVADLERALAGAGAGPATVKRISPSLENVFLSAAEPAVPEARNETRN